MIPSVVRLRLTHVAGMLPGNLQTMANYTRRNLTDYAQQTSMAFFKTWANLVRMITSEI